jgi:hypothetical protein
LGAGSRRLFSSVFVTPYFVYVHVERHDVPTTPELERDLLTSPRVNASEHGPYQKYYDDETRELVTGQCHDIIETYGYTFE